MIINYIKQKEILDFEKEIGCPLIVKEYRNRDYRFVAEFKLTGICVSPSVVGYVCGIGNTVDEALINYCNKISGKNLRIGWGSGARCLTCPELTHTRFNN